MIGNCSTSIHYINHYRHTQKTEIGGGTGSAPYDECSRINRCITTAHCDEFRATVTALQRASISHTRSPVGRKAVYSCGKLGLPTRNMSQMSVSYISGIQTKTSLS